MAKNLNFQAPVALAIAEGAITPNPGIVGVSVWSTTLSKPVYWTGSQWTAGGGGGSPAGTTGQVQFNNAGLFAGAASVSIGGEGNLLLASLSSRPAAPPVGQLQVYGRSRAGQDYLDVQQSSGLDYPLQPHLGVNRICTWSTSSGATVVASGMARSAVGTTSHPALAATNFSASIRRWRVTSAVTENSVCDERTVVTTCWRGNAEGLGGFSLITRISLAAVPALSRAFFGLTQSLAVLATTANPQALLNVIGIGFNEGTDANWQILHNDNAGVCTKIDLGASFPVSSLTNVYTLFIGAEPYGSSVFVRVVEEVSGAVAEHELTTNIPASAIFFGVRQYMNNGGTAAACAYDCSGVYLKTDF